MKEIIHLNSSDAAKIHRNDHPDYEFHRRNLLPFGTASQCAVYMYEIPPGKSAFPYHYHVKNEESFYILKGQGILKTPAGEKPVTEGDYIFFPANENGAHKLTNSSNTENLVYLDFDTINDLDISLYPDSGKIGIWGKNINKLYNAADNIDYYDGE